MVRWCTPTASDLRAWQELVAEAEAPVRAVAEFIDPWSLYRLHPSGFRGTYIGLKKVDGAVQVGLSVCPKFNLVLGEMVLYVPFLALDPCELPGPGERIGLIDVPRRADGWVTVH
ncbi:MAG: hypothetical protein ACRYG8_23385 [Janthinobacterium lividum]